MSGGKGGKCCCLVLFILWCCLPATQPRMPMPGRKNLAILQGLLGSSFQALEHCGVLWCAGESGWALCSSDEGPWQAG
eukprot:494174-Amphidinium_carterae.1